MFLAYKHFIRRRVLAFLYDVSKAAVRIAAFGKMIAKQLGSMRFYNLVYDCHAIIAVFFPFFLINSENRNSEHYP